VLEVVVQPLSPASERAQEQGVAALLPAGFDGWFARCVVRDQAQRFADATQCYDALEGLLGVAPTAAAPAPFVAPAPPPAAPPVPRAPTQAAPMPGGWPQPIVLPQWPPAAPPQQQWSQPVAPPAVQWPMVQQRVYASVQGGPYQLATVLAVNKQTAMIHIRLDAGGEGWVPAAHLRATY
jgi:hypothetical protein